MSAFDRLFDRAASKLNVQCSREEKDEAKRHFVERYGEELEVLERSSPSPISESALRSMESAIDGLPPAQLAGYLAAGPLANHVQEHMRGVALRAAENRLIEHWVQQADDTYGGN